MWILYFWFLSVSFINFIPKRRSSIQNETTCFHWSYRVTIRQTLARSCLIFYCIDSSQQKKLQQRRSWLEDFCHQAFWNFFRVVSNIYEKYSPFIERRASFLLSSKSFAQLFPSQINFLSTTTTLAWFLKFFRKSPLAKQIENFKIFFYQINNCKKDFSETKDWILHFQVSWDSLLF